MFISFSVGQRRKSSPAQYHGGVQNERGHEREEREELCEELIEGETDSSAVQAGQVQVLDPPPRNRARNPSKRISLFVGDMESRCELLQLPERLCPHAGVKYGQGDVLRRSQPAE